MIKVNYPQSNEILFLRGDINYTEFHLLNGKMIVSSTTLLRHQERLDGFLRVSRKHLVNLKYVKGIDKRGPYIRLELVDGNLLRISRRRLGFVKSKIY